MANKKVYYSVHRAKQHRQRSYLTDAQISKIADTLDQSYNQKYLIGFYLCLVSGQKFTHLKRLKWDSYNGRMALIRMGDRTIRLPKKLNQKIDKLRDKARSEKSLIMPIQYKIFWSNLDKIGIEMGIHKMGVLKLRNTFARRHYARYQNKHQLKQALGLSSLRYIPDDIWRAKKEPLFSDLLI